MTGVISTIRIPTYLNRLNLPDINKKLQSQ